MLLPLGVQLSYSVLDVRICSAKFFKNSSKDFDAKRCSRMNTRSTRQYAMFAPAQLLCNWREQRPSKQG
jgi:hypothetical protein